MPKPLCGKNMPAKLSQIIIEIAMQGLKDKKYAESEVMHILMFLAHIAWNRHARSPDYLPRGKYLKHLKKFPISKQKLRDQLISNNWEEILTIMIDYKKHHFPDDTRVIMTCGTTPRGTFRVEWR